jgi:demethylmenaquinone methyltransferase/2-methoxy-6-polyprenyl-1,4-benzoquinol methylase
MIVLGRKKAVQAGVAGRIGLAVASAEGLPFSDGVFDAATVAFGLRNVSNRRQGLSEMHRVLRPGGRAVVLEFSTPPGRLFRAIYLWYFHRVLPLIGRLVSGHHSAYSYLPNSVAEFPSPTELASRMKEIGFREVSWRLLTSGIVAIHVGVKGSG